MGFDFIVIVPLLLSYCGFSFVFGCGVSFLVSSSVFLSMIVQQLVVILVLSQEGVRALPSTPPYWSRATNFASSLVFSHQNYQLCEGTVSGCLCVVFPVPCSVQFWRGEGPTQCRAAQGNGEGGLQAQRKRQLMAEAFTVLSLERNR